MLHHTPGEGKRFDAQVLGYTKYAPTDALNVSAHAPTVEVVAHGLPEELAYYASATVLRYVAPAVPDAGEVNQR